MSNRVLKSDWGQEPLTVGPEIPTVALRFLLGRIHVATPDEEIEQLILERIGRADKRGVVYSPKQREQTIAAALWLHHENYAEYLAVVTGSI